MYYYLAILSSVFSRLDKHSRSRNEYSDEQPNIYSYHLNKYLAAHSLLQGVRLAFAEEQLMTNYLKGISEQQDKQMVKVTAKRIDGLLSNYGLLEMLHAKLQSTYNCNYVAPEKMHKTEMQPIIPNLFIGPLKPAQSRETLIAHGITHILCCMDTPPSFPNDFRYLVIPAKDCESEDMTKFFDCCFAFIREAIEVEAGTVYVHCSKGISRSPTICIAYLMKALKMTFWESFHVVKTARPFINPRNSFCVQLLNYESAFATTNI